MVSFFKKYLTLIPNLKKKIKSGPADDKKQFWTFIYPITLSVNIEKCISDSNKKKYPSSHQTFFDSLTAVPKCMYISTHVHYSIHLWTWFISFIKAYVMYCTISKNVYGYNWILCTMEKLLRIIMTLSNWTFWCFDRFQYAFINNSLN